MPENFGNWTSANNWCNGMSPRLNHLGGFYSPSMDCKIDRVFPILVPLKGVCCVAATGEGQTTPVVLTAQAVDELERWAA